VGIPHNAIWFVNVLTVYIGDAPIIGQ